MEDAFRLLQHMEGHKEWAGVLKEPPNTHAVTDVDRGAVSEGSGHYQGDARKALKGQFGFSLVVKCSKPIDPAKKVMLAVPAAKG